MNHMQGIITSIQKRQRRAIALGALLLFGTTTFVGCGGGTGSSTPTARTTLTGTWSGVLGQDLLSLDLTQTTSNALTGSATYTTTHIDTGILSGSATLPDFSCTVDFPVSVGAMTVTGKLQNTTLKIHAQRHLPNGSVLEADGRLEYVPPQPPPVDNSGGE